jgi:hypothetical protein
VSFRLRSRTAFRLTAFRRTAPRTSALAAAAVLSGSLAGLAPVAAAPAAASEVIGNSASYKVQTIWNAQSGRSELVRWDPCKEIGYKVNAYLGGREGLRDVQAAVARLSAASGLRFRYLGSTTFVPSVGRSQSAVAPLVIAWARPYGQAGGSSYSRPSETGRGGWSATWGAGKPVRITSGYVVVRAGQPLAMGFGKGVTRGRVLLHELGHAVGLDHVHDPVMAMDDVVSYRSPIAAYQAGDRTGLRKVGNPTGCVA